MGVGVIHTAAACGVQYLTFAFFAFFASVFHLPFRNPILCSRSDPPPYSSGACTVHIWFAAIPNPWCERAFNVILALPEWVC